jgi:DNA polymerase-3 subunit gamma/tau
MLYNEYRPIKFSSVTGQAGVKILAAQSKRDRMAHTYLMVGASGSGKTTTARIVAMALLCQFKTDGEPCGACPDCKDIQRGNHWDIIELNAAADPDIAGVQDLIRKAPLCPTNGRHKVYIIDECHRYTVGAWSALLKLLEDTPAHLTIILCTTEDKKCPDTIASRCQIIPFIPLTPADIAKRLLSLVMSEGASLDQTTINQIADNVNGNMRQAETMLEQVLCAA